jgi:hypothetical protein
VSDRTPRSPNVPLIIVGLVTAASSALTLGHLIGWRVPSLAEVAPESILLVGAAILVAGIIGLRRERRRQSSPNPANPANPATPPPTSS